MRIHKTGHEIADTVADAFNGYEGDADLVYGILRHNVFQSSNSWFNVDRGYFNPGHFDGYYRISYKGTQAKWHDDIPKADVDIELEDWNEVDGVILVCPPTPEVANFFGITFSTFFRPIPEHKVRYKGDNNPIDWGNIKGVVTFNSSIGWQALQRGIPCISDTEHSIVGSYYKHELGKKGLDYTFDNVKLVDREPLFKAMQAHQFTLKEIREGKAWGLLKHYLNRAESNTA